MPQPYTSLSKHRGCNQWVCGLNGGQRDPRALNSATSAYLHPLVLSPRSARAARAQICWRICIEGQRFMHGFREMHITAYCHAHLVSTHSCTVIPLSIWLASIFALLPPMKHVRLETLTLSAHRQHPLTYFTPAVVVDISHAHSHSPQVPTWVWSGCWAALCCRRETVRTRWNNARIHDLQREVEKMIDTIYILLRSVHNIPPRAVVSLRLMAIKKGIKARQRVHGHGGEWIWVCMLLCAQTIPLCTSVRIFSFVDCAQRRFISIGGFLWANKIIWQFGANQ